VLKIWVQRKIFGPKGRKYRRLEKLYNGSINKYYSGDQIKQDEISRAYGTYGGETQQEL
jgi:hypothetical protein